VWRIGEAEQVEGKEMAEMEAVSSRSSAPPPPPPPPLPSIRAAPMVGTQVVAPPPPPPVSEGQTSSLTEMTKLMKEELEGLGKDAVVEEEGTPDLGEKDGEVGTSNEVLEIKHVRPREDDLVGVPELIPQQPPVVPLSAPTTPAAATISAPSDDVKLATVAKRGASPPAERVIDLNEDSSVVLESGIETDLGTEPVQPLELDDEGQTRRKDAERSVVDELIRLEESNPRPSRVNLTKGKLESSKTVRAAKKFGHDLGNKTVDVALAAKNIVEGTAKLSEQTGIFATGMASTAVSHATPKIDIPGAFREKDIGPQELATRGPDTVSKLDVIGTNLKDIGAVRDEQNAVGQNSADSPLNTPFILFLAPILPLGVMYTITVMKTLWPSMKVVGLFFLSFISLRLVVWSCMASFVGVVFSWKSIREVEALRPLTLKVDQQLETVHNAIYERRKEMDPKIDEMLDKIYDVLKRLDDTLVSKAGIELEKSFRATVHGWKFDPTVSDVCLDDPPTNALAITGREVLDEGSSDRTSFELFFDVEIILQRICDLHTNYSSLWVEWHVDNMVAAHVPLRDVQDSTNAVDYSDTRASLNHEVMMTYHPSREIDNLVDKLEDAGIRLVVKGRKELPIYSNDGARRYHASRNDVFIVGEINLSAKKIGVGANRGGLVESELRIPVHAIGFKGMRTATIFATARIKPVLSSSYSYRASHSDLPSGDWTVRVNVIELRSLHASDQSGSSDPFVEVVALGQVKATHSLRKTLSCVFDEMLYFTSEMRGSDIETSEIVVNVKDWNRFGSVLIGKVQFDVKSIFYEKGSEILRRWFAITNTENGTRGTQGYVKLSVAVVGPGLVPKPHSEAEDAEEFQKATLLKNLVVNPPLMTISDWTVHVCIGWADMLPRMKSDSRDVVRGFIEMNYTGYPKLAGRTFIAEAREIIDPTLEDNCRVYPQRRVVWNEEYVFPLKVINGLVNQDGVWFRLYHRDSNGNPHLLGEIYFSFADLTKSITKAVIRGQAVDKEKPGDRLARVAMMKPRYFNMYGPAEGDLSSSRKGVAYRGRVLIGAASKPGAVDRVSMRSCPPPPRPRLALYQVEFQVSRATELPLQAGWMVAVEVRAGIYSFGHSIPRVTARNQCVQWDEGSLVRITNLRFPDDIRQIPDFFITLWTRKPRTVSLLEEQSDEDRGPLSPRGDRDEQWSPFAFIRLPANHLIHPQSQPKWMFMDYPGESQVAEADRVPGSLLFRCNLTMMGRDPSEEASGIDEERSLYAQGIRRSEMTTKPEMIEGPTLVEPAMSNSGTFSPAKGEEKLYELRALVIQGRNLPAADSTGLSDPFVVISVGDQSRKGTIICKQTIAPLWKETILVSNISVRHGERLPNVNVLVYDWDEDNEFDYLGRALVPSSDLDETEPRVEHAQWYPVFSMNPESVVGEILADFQLVEQQRAMTVPSLTVMPRATKSCMRISLIGLRDMKFLRYATGNVYCEMTVSGDSIHPVRSKRAAILQTGSYEGNANVLDVLLLDINIPEDLRLAPALNLYVYAEYAHRSTPEMLATACIRLGKWLNGFESRYLSMDELGSDPYGTADPVPHSLAEQGYIFKSSASVSKSRLFLNKVQSNKTTSVQAGPVNENDVFQHHDHALVRKGFPSTKQTKFSEIAKKIQLQVDEIMNNVAITMAHARQSRHAVTGAIFDLMPDVATRLGVPEPGEELILAGQTPEEDRQDSSAGSTEGLKEERGFCPQELEHEFSHPSYGEFILRRGDSRTIGLDSGEIKYDDAGPGERKLVMQERKRAQLEGKSPAVGKVKVRLDLVDIDGEDEGQLQHARLVSLRSFGRIFVPTEVIVRVYILRGISLQQVGASCNSYLKVSFFGGYPNVFSTKHRPIMRTDNPEYYEMFESRVKMPGGSIRIEVKDRMLPEVTLPVRFPWLTKDETSSFPKLGLASKDVTLSTNQLGLGWSETIGETTLDLDNRWYNAAWKALEKTPVEVRSLWKGDSMNLKGKLEVFVDIISAADYHANPKLYRSPPIIPPVQKKYMLRVVIFNTENAMLPYKKEPRNPNKLAAFYVECRLGNRTEDIRRTDTCRYSADGQGQFNWRLNWWVELPDPSLQPRLKFLIFDDTSHGLGSDDLCATADVKMRTMFDEMVTKQTTIVKKKQWIVMGHPDHPGVQARCQLAIEFIPESEVSKKRCMYGSESYNIKQHPDYILARPFRPAPFSLFNPVPFINYQIANTVNGLTWTISTFLLPFAFLPMLLQFLWQTPWWWYLMSGIAGLVVMLRIVLVDLGRASAVAAAELEAARLEEEDDSFVTGGYETRFNAPHEAMEAIMEEEVDHDDEDDEDRRERLKREAHERAQKELMRTHTGLEVGLSRPVNLNG